MLGLLARELQERPAARIVGREPGPSVVEQERQNELLDQAEEIEIAVAADLVEQQLVARRQVESGGARQGVRHERLVEVETLVAADDVLDLPVDALRGRER